MKFFFFHILLKDLSFMIIYFILMKYNLTNETYLPSTISNFPGAPTMTFWNMISAALFYNLIPLIFSFISYFFIVKLFDSICDKMITRTLLTGFALTLTTPILYFVMSNYHHNDYYLLKAESISWTISFLISIITYSFFNRKRKVGEYIFA